MQVCPFMIIHHRKGAQGDTWQSNTTKEGGTWKSMCKRSLKAYFGHFGPQVGPFSPLKVRHLRQLFPAATVEFLPQTLYDCISCSQVSSTKISVESEPPQRKFDFPPFCACLLCAATCCLLLAACCLLLLARKGTSTLDFKEVYKTFLVPPA